MAAPSKPLGRGGAHHFCIVANQRQGGTVATGRGLICVPPHRLYMTGRTYAMGCAIKLQSCQGATITTNGAGRGRTPGHDSHEGSTTPLPRAGEKFRTRGSTHCEQCPRTQADREARLRYPERAVAGRGHTTPLPESLLKRHVKHQASQVGGTCPGPQRHAKGHRRLDQRWRAEAGRGHTTPLPEEPPIKWQRKPQANHTCGTYPCPRWFKVRNEVAGHLQAYQMKKGFGRND